MKRPAWTLIEMMVALAIVLGASAVCAPVLSGYIAQQRFHGFETQLQAQLVMARELAQRLETSVRITLDTMPEAAYRLSYEEDGDWHEFAVAEPFPEGCGFHLPEVSLPHPSRAGTLTKAVSSTHAPSVIFTAHGSSSATLVLSGPNQQVFCAVIASTSGRIRCFRWMGTHWRNQL